MESDGASAGVTGGGDRRRGRKGERRTYRKGREQKLPGESEGVTGGESAGVTREGGPGEPGEGEGCSTYCLVSMLRYLGYQAAVRDCSLWLASGYMSPSCGPPRPP